MSRNSRICLLTAALLTISGCRTVHYLAQASYGHFEIRSGARPIREILIDDNAPPKLKSLLSHVPKIKRFGSSRGLTLSESYNEFVQLDRDAALWLVTACQELQFEPQTWSFPIVGTVPYLGWYNHRDAERFAATLAERGLDVDIRPVSAYSTLGWFRDPILSSMISRRRNVVGDFTNVVLHEAVHATLLIPDQAPFNESLALFVADGITPAYLRSAFDKRSGVLREHLAAEARSGERKSSMFNAYRRLQQLYASNLTKQEKRKRKAKILGELATRVDATRPINNATLIDFRTYHIGNEALSKLLAACDGDWPRFMKAVSSVTAESFTEEDQEELEWVFEPRVEDCPVP